MLESGWLFVGIVGVLATGVGLLTTEDVLATVLGVVGFVSFAIWTYGTLDVRVVGDAVTYQFQMPALTVFGLVLLLPPAYLALTGPINVVGKARSPRTDEI